MAVEWKSSTWGEEISLEYGKSLRGYKTASGKYRVFGSNGPIGWTDQPLTQGPGVILGRKGAYRGIEFSREPFFVIDTAYYVVPKTELDMRWLYYAIKYHKLGEIDDGSPIPSTTRAAVYVRDLDIPPLEVQRAIASILGALDDKIELNRRMNATLESLARAIFKSWFVDFDPVRRNAGLKGDDRSVKGEKTEPDLSPFNIHNSLFPSSFQDSELGKIPAGWSVGRLDDLLVLQRGFDLPKTNRTNGKFPVYAAGGHHGFHNEFKVKGPGIVTGRSGVLGNVYYVHEDHWPLNTTLWVKEFKRALPIYAFHHLQDLGLGGFNAGSAVPTLNRNHVHGLPTLVAPLEVVEKYEEVAQPLLDRQRHNERESSTLSTLRDTLLPKLLSGELPVPAALTDEALA